MMGFEGNVWLWEFNTQWWCLLYDLWCYKPRWISWNPYCG